MNPTVKFFCPDKEQVTKHDLYEGMLNLIEKYAWQDNGEISFSVLATLYLWYAVILRDFFSSDTVLANE